jgi:serine/threonine protein kinase
MSRVEAVQRTLAGRYELHEVIGRGGMGVVYRAHDLVLRRDVAVKVLPPLLAEEQPEYPSRFEREARLAASLNHPRIVAVYDSGVQDETRFIVMELVGGESLASIMRRDAPLSSRRTARIACGVADALAAAHAAGLVHRDIKPANVMVDAAAEVKVLDFGIAKALGGTGPTREMAVLGSAAYMSPEQARGQPVDARSDIYSLGCLIYAMLTGRAPFSGEGDAAILNQQINGLPRPPGELRGGVPPALEQLVMEMLAKDPERRPQRAARVRALLGEFGSDTAASTAIRRPPAADPTTVLAPRRRRRRSPDRRVLAGAAVVLALLTGALLAFASGGGSPGRTAVRQRSGGSRSSATTSTAATRVPTATASTPAATVAAEQPETSPNVPAAAPGARPDAAPPGPLQAGHDTHPGPPAGKAKHHGDHGHDRGD